ncbi:hypothetical protein BBP40_001473 [Aspergillus hancockii]|nr:hypothetical protein BBP40_001473 [Aspergillus hancockii]
MVSQTCKVYSYQPSLALAAISTTLFAGLTAVHSFRMIRTKTWSNIPFVLGGLAQLSGYTARLFSTQDLCNRVAYGFQSALLLLGPTLLMFTVNLTHTAFIKALNAEHFCWIPVVWQRPLYPSMNIVLMLVQVIGGIMTTSSSSPIIASASKIIIATFIIQLVFWGFIFAENANMTFRLGHHPTASSQNRLPKRKTWNQLFGLSTSIIGFGRNVMRLTMYGGIGFLVDNEWPSYAFDGIQMVVVMGAGATWYLPEKCEEVTGKSNYISLERRRRATDGEES